MYSIPSYYELGSCSSSGNFLQGVVLSSSRTTTTNMGNSSCSTAEKKAEAASKNHSEAERRRRKRINTHLATLRTLLPKTIKVSCIYRIYVMLQLDFAKRKKSRNTFKMQIRTPSDACAYGFFERFRIQLCPDMCFKYV